MVEFSAFRDVPFPTQYGPNRSAVTVDVVEAGLVAAVLILIFSLLLVLPGVKGLRQGISVTLRIGFALFVATVILVCNFSYEWQVGHVKADLQYKQFTSQHVPAELGLRVGLRGINVTLKGHPSREVVFNNVTETIDYNEHFTFGWDQRLNGFGPNAAQLNQELRQAQRRGLPLPILSVVEYFALDGESIRWGRLYRQAGYYSHILMWLALPLWILCCFLSTYLSLLYGAICLMLTGACLLWACVVFVGIHTIESRLVIPVEGTLQLTLSYGWGFGLCLATGMLCMVIGLVLTILVCYMPLWAASVFGTSLLEVDDSQDGAAEGDWDNEDAHDYEHVRPRLLTVVGGGGAPSRPTKPSNGGDTLSPGAFSRTSIRNSFRRRHLTRQPSTASAHSASSGGGGSGAHSRPQVKWRRPRPASSLSMTVLQTGAGAGGAASELGPVSCAHLALPQERERRSNPAAGSNGAADSGATAAPPQPQQQATIILYNAVDVSRRAGAAMNKSPHPPERRAPPPRPPARTVSRFNTGTSVLPTEAITYTTQATRECTL